MKYTGIKNISEKAMELKKRNRKIIELRERDVSINAISARFGITMSRVCWILRREKG